MRHRQRNASEATQLAVPTLATAALAGAASYLLTNQRNVAGLSAGVGALIGLGLALYTKR